MPATDNRPALDDVTAHRINELRAKDPAFIVGDQWHVLALADKMEACQGLLNACAPFLKDGETPAECIARNRKDTDSVLTLLAREKRQNEAFEAGRVNAPSGTTSEQVAIAPKGSACESPALLTSNERLNRIESIQLGYDVRVSVHTDREYPWDFVELRDKDPNGPTYLDMTEARQLRDWLNRALPDETKAEYCPIHPDVQIVVRPSTVKSEAPQLEPIHVAGPDSPVIGHREVKR